MVYLKFSYDVYNLGVVQTNQATLPAGTNPGMITKVNILHMTMRSQTRDAPARSAQSNYGGYEGLDSFDLDRGSKSDFAAGIPNLRLRVLMARGPRRNLMPPGGRNELVSGTRRNTMRNDKLNSRGFTLIASLLLMLLLSGVAVSLL